MDFWLCIIFKKINSFSHAKNRWKREKMWASEFAQAQGKNTAGALIQMRNNMSCRIICKSTVGMNVMQFPFGPSHMNTLRTAPHLESQTFSSLLYVYLMSLQDLMLQDMFMFRDRCYNATQTQTNMQNIVSYFEKTKKIGYGIALLNMQPAGHFCARMFYEILLYTMVNPQCNLKTLIPSGNLQSTLQTVPQTRTYSTASLIIMEAI